MAESIQTGKVEEKDIECLEIPKEQNRLPCDSKQILNLKVALRSSDMWQNPFLRATLIWSLVLDDTFLVRCWKDLSKMNLHNHPLETAASYKTSPTWVWAAFPCTYNKLSFISAGTSLPAFPPWPSHNVAAALSVLALHCSHPGLLWWVETTEVPALVAHRMRSALATAAKAFSLPGLLLQWLFSVWPAQYLLTGQCLCALTVTCSIWLLPAFLSSLFPCILKYSNI